MNIEIDQSGKVENTSVDTIIAYSNGSSKSIRIAARDKRKIQKIYRSSGKTHLYIYKTFALLIYLLIENSLLSLDSVIIDIEYPGWNFLIKDFLLQEIRKKTSGFQ
ncbi:MAG: hypothetical protein ABII13_01085 [Patescibacteria group bacterium]|nr:hypothetical protein [Patescibacteria group bacterium]MBU2509393.1 hypothetical protein [Patescibacteria group bacterium]